MTNITYSCIFINISSYAHNIIPISNIHFEYFSTQKYIIPATATLFTTIYKQHYNNYCTFILFYSSSFIPILYSRSSRESNDKLKMRHR